MYFSETWEEVASLTDGQQVTLRLLRASDREELLAAFEQLSDHSRYRRFLTAMPTLTRAQLDYLTQIDNVHHTAIVATHELADRTEEGVGLGRFVRLADRPELAEPALTVVDPMQGRGLGTLLMMRLCQAAKERGVEGFYVEFLASNTPVLKLLEQVSDDTLLLSREGEVYSAEFPVPDIPVGEVVHHAAWLELLTLAASHARAMRRHAADLKGEGFHKHQ